ncbi:hypothetical protein B0T26DRAFT_679275 [Lasiosphaeria miniovina]|uniref:TLDc domain-containing protein n=1 Tax=Lasiosphaeria miniovina TaxID=1954250 RepID=A0AA40DN78_9PEZI|nr:uncharacterized protein B0T26DRAFT_679275 [Lasiosphaeria miniovina]KAK0709924.1 hypothetical protein B0T26DRAFT_679275 [Lasiosphaeria miniovina]
MENKWPAKQISDWVVQGALGKEAVWERVDKAVEGSYNFPFGGEPKPILASLFHSLSTSEGLLTEATFIGLLQTKVDLPRSPDGVIVGKILFSSLAYLSTVPFPSSTTTAPPRGRLSLAQLARALVWIVPDNYGYIVEEGNFSRQRSKADHRRLIFQSLASRLDREPHYDAENARRLALHNAFEVEYEARREYCALNHDGDGDEIYHDLLDVLYGTQIKHDPRYAPVHRDDFRPVAKQIAAENDLDRLYALGIPVDRFVALVKLLLDFQFTQSDENDDENRDLGPSRFDAAARSVCAAFHHQNAVQGDDGATSAVITWPMFDHGLKNVAPYLFDPLYHIISTVFMGKRGPGISYLLDAPSPLPSGTPLTMVLLSQLTTFLGGSADFASFRRTLHYSASDDLPKTASELIKAMEAISEEAVMMLSARSEGSGETYVFGVFSYKPQQDVGSIQTNVIPSYVGQERCAIFQLAPVQDIFRGVVGKPGWTVTGSDTVVFGQPGGGGVVLMLEDGLRSVDIAHQVPITEGDGNSGGYVYEPNVWRGNWSTSLHNSDIEIWTDQDN